MKETISYLFFFFFALEFFSILFFSWIAKEYFVDWKMNASNEHSMVYMHYLMELKEKLESTTTCNVYLVSHHGMKPDRTSFLIQTILSIIIYTVPLPLT